MILLRPYIENKTHGANFPRPPPELLGEEFYEVESIIRHRRWGRGYQYLLKWKGYPITNATWESESAFSEDGNMLTAYKDRHQLWRRRNMSYPYPYHLLPFETYQEWFDADWKSLIHCVCGLQNKCVYLKLFYTAPHPQCNNVLDYLSEVCILQVNDIRHELLDIRLALLCGEELSTLLWLQ